MDEKILRWGTKQGLIQQFDPATGRRRPRRPPKTLAARRTRQDRAAAAGGAALRLSGTAARGGAGLVEFSRVSAVRPNRVGRSDGRDRALPRRSCPCSCSVVARPARLWPWWAAGTPVRPVKAPCSTLWTWVTGQLNYSRMIARTTADR